MNCPECREETYVKYKKIANLTRQLMLWNSKARRRRRVCARGHEFSTYEISDVTYNELVRRFEEMTKRAIRAEANQR